MKASSVPELKTGQMMTIAYLIAIVIVLFIVYKILTAVGLIKTAAKRRELKAETAAESELRDMDYFNFNILKGNKTYKPLGDPAKQYAYDIHKALKGWGTNEERIFTTFGKLNNNLNIAEVALCYKQGFNADMLTDILNDLNDNEKLDLFNIINKLPNK